MKEEHRKSERIVGQVVSFVMITGGYDPSSEGVVSILGWCMIGFDGRSAKVEILYHPRARKLYRDPCPDY